MENFACCFPRYKMNLAKFQPGSQRGLRLPLLLLVVVEDGRHVLPAGHHGGHHDHHESGQHDGHNESGHDDHHESGQHDGHDGGHDDHHESGQHFGHDDGHESGHDDHHESDHHDGHHGGTDRDLEQAFAEFGSWFCQKKTRSLAKVTTLGSYSTCAGLDMSHSQMFQKIESG